MDTARPKNTNKLLSLKQAAEQLAVSADVLLNLNEHNILKPTITLTGEIGYTEEQIENFLKIQKISIQGPVGETNVISDAKYLHTPPVTADKLPDRSFPTAGNSFNQTSTVATANYQQANTQPSHSQKSGKLFPFLTISSLSFLFFVSILFVISGIDISSGNMKNNTELPTSPSSASIQSKTTHAYNGLNNENVNVLDEKIALRDVVFEEQSSDAQSPEEESPLPDKEQTTSGNNPSNLTGFASRTNCPTCVDDGENTSSIFDEKGNLKGEPKSSNLLASAPIGQTRIEISDNSSSDTVLLAFLGLGFLSMMFIFRNQFAYLGEKNRRDNADRLASPAIQKILEVTQKTDGSVVFYFLGTEYKVSKPELDSESDQFISRLMELVGEGVKEIDYDILHDEKVRFNTPLSKLVTRLGFVGLKRDLFFPRTSKSKVLFRSYITQNDLIAMSLTPEQITPQLSLRN